MSDGKDKANSELEKDCENQSLSPSEHVIGDRLNER